MRSAIVVMLAMLVVSLCLAQGIEQPGSPGDIVSQTDEGQGDATGSAGTIQSQTVDQPAQEQVVQQKTTEWQTEDRAAKTAQASGNHTVARRHRARANALAIEICKLGRQVTAVDKYHRANPLGGTAESQQKAMDLLLKDGFVTWGNLVKYLTSLGINPAVPPAPVALPAEPAPQGEGNMSAILWTAVIIFGAVAVAWLIWSQINNGTRIARGEGYLTRLEELAYGGGRGARAGAATPATAADAPTAGEAGEWRANAAGLADMGDPDDYEVTGGNGPSGSWMRYRARRGSFDRQPVASGVQAPGVVNIDLRDLHLDLGDERPFGQRRR